MDVFQREKPPVGPPPGPCTPGLFMFRPTAACGHVDWSIETAHLEEGALGSTGDQTLHGWANGSFLALAVDT